MASRSPHIIMALDLGTTSTRVALYDADGKTVTIVAREHQQYFPQPGRGEHDASEIWSNLRELMPLAFARAQLTASDIATVRITNHRDTVDAWTPSSSQPRQR